MTEAPQWTWNDGWILMAIHRAGKDAGAELHEIWAVADATNHAIPGAREISSALTKFVQYGLVRAEDGKYAVATEHVAALQKAYERRGGLFATGDKGFAWLNRSQFIRRSATGVDVTETELAKAYQRYTKSFQ